MKLIQIHMSGLSTASLQGPLKRINKIKERDVKMIV